MTYPTQLRSELGIGALFDVVPDAVIVGDVTSGRIVLWNAAASELFGYSSGDAVGMELERLVAPEIRALHLAGIHAFAKTGTGELVGTHRLAEVPALHRSGHPIWVEMRLAAVGAGDPQRYVVAVARDISARRIAQAEALSNAEAAQRAEARMRDVLAMVAHDLRTPLTAIQTAALMLGSKWDRLADADRLNLLDVTHRQTAHMVGLLDTLLDLTSAEAGELAASPEVVPLAAAVVEAVATTGLEDIAIRVDDDSAVYADASHVQRILVNLIGNAGKYGAPPISVSTEINATSIRLHVDDMGPGVPEDFAPQLFDRFTRAGESNVAGHGLGLAITRALAEVNKGSVLYTSLDPGARFTVELPTRTDDP